MVRKNCYMIRLKVLNEVKQMVYWLNNESDFIVYLKLNDYSFDKQTYLGGYSLFVNNQFLQFFK